MLESTLTANNPGPGNEEMAKRLASAIEDYIRKQATDVLNSAKSAYSDFTKRVDSSTTHYDESVYPEDAPESIVNDPAKLAKFTYQRDHIYDGPMNITDSQDWAAIVNRGQDTSKLSQMTTTQEGQEILLKRVFDSPEYTIAHLKLDLEILQLHPPKPVLEADQLCVQLATMVDSAAKYAAQAKSETDDARDRTVKLVQGKFDAFKSYVQNLYEVHCINRHDNQNDIRTDLKAASLSTLTLNTLGDQMRSIINSHEVIYTMDLSQYVTCLGDPTVIEYSPDWMFDRSEAYSKLLNRENLFLPLPMKEQGEPPLATFDYTRMENDRVVAKNAYQSAYDHERKPFSYCGVYCGDLTIDQIRTNFVRRHPGSEGARVGNIEIAARESELAQRFQINRTIGVR